MLCPGILNAACGRNSQQGRRAGDGDSGILAFVGFPITANRMHKRALTRGLNAAKGNQELWGCGHFFLLWSESVNGAWKDDDD